MRNTLKILIAVNIFTAIFFTPACSHTEPANKKENTMKNTTVSNIDTATFGAGCFWCVEAVFKRLNGVIKVVSGYSGGSIKNPAYREVCAGTTGHAEVCRITYDKTKIGFKDLLEVFWQTHDPTTLNKQGADAGTQYRSVIFYHNTEQKELAEKFKAELDKSGAFEKQIVTEILPYSSFYVAEDYHQNYFDLNGKEPYCQYVIQPKIDKFEEVFKNKMK